MSTERFNLTLEEFHMKIKIMEIRNKYHFTGGDFWTRNIDKSEEAVNQDRREMKETSDKLANLLCECLWDRKLSDIPKLEFKRDSIIPENCKEEKYKILQVHKDRMSKLSKNTQCFLVEDGVIIESIDGKFRKFFKTRDQYWDYCEDYFNNELI